MERRFRPFEGRSCFIFDSTLLLPQIHSVLVCHPYSQQVTFVSYASKDSPLLRDHGLESAVTLASPKTCIISCIDSSSSSSSLNLTSSSLVSASCHDKEIDYNPEEKTPTYHSEVSPTREGSVFIVRHRDTKTLKSVSLDISRIVEFLSFKDIPSMCTFYFSYQ